MASATTLCKKIFNVKGLKVESCTLREDEFGAKHLDLGVWPTKGTECRYPIFTRNARRKDFLFEKAASGETLILDCFPFT